MVTRSVMLLSSSTTSTRVGAAAVCSTPRWWHPILGVCSENPGFPLNQGRRAPARPQSRGSTTALPESTEIEMSWVEVGSVGTSMEVLPEFEWAVTA